MSMHPSRQGVLWLSLILLLASGAFSAFQIPAQPLNGNGSAVQPDEPPNGDEPPFEEMSTREVTAAQAIAEIERRRQARESARALSRIRNLLSFEFHDIRGSNDQEILHEAGVRALTSAAAQLYFGDYILIGRDILEPYLRNYGDRFIVRRTILSRRVLPDGLHELDVRVGVNADTFYHDLQTKHFMAKPRVRPVMAVVIEEIIDGKPSDEGQGRKVLEEALRRAEMRIESDRMGPHPLNIDATKTPEAMAQAREEAERGEVEVLVTGAIEMTMREPRKILYDDFVSYDGWIQLRFVRVDTGEIIRDTRQVFSTSATAPEGSPEGSAASEALRKAFENLIPRASAVVTENFLADWQRAMLDNADFRLMVTGVDNQQLESVFNMLKTISPSVEAYVKSFYSGVAVINVYYPGGTSAELEEFLRKSRIPQFRVLPEDSRRFELRVL